MIANGELDLIFFAHRLGHGIGLQGHENPYFVGNNDVVLQPGMTLTVEPGIYVPDKFGIRLEDVIMVTPTGFEVFGPTSKNLTTPIE